MSQVYKSYQKPLDHNDLWHNLDDNMVYVFNKNKNEWKPISNQDGSSNPGFSPVVSINKVGTKTEIKITDSKGDHIANIYDGEDGQKGDPGEDGISPTIQAERVSNGVKLTITDKNGSHSAVLNDGIGDGSTVSTFADVPSDGKSYLRQNGAWVEGATKAELNNLGSKVGEIQIEDEIRINGAYNALILPIVKTLSIQKRGERIAVLTRISVEKNITYNIKFNAIEGVFSNCQVSVRDTSDDASLAAWYPNNKEQESYAFVSDTDRDITLWFIAYGGSSLATLKIEWVQEGSPLTKSVQEVLSVTEKHEEDIASILGGDFYSKDLQYSEGGYYDFRGNFVAGKGFFTQDVDINDVKEIRISGVTGDTGRSCVFYNSNGEIAKIVQERKEDYTIIDASFYSSAKFSFTKKETLIEFKNKSIKNEIESVEANVNSERGRALEQENALLKKIDASKTMLQNQINSIKPVEYSGNVVNAPDNEDLTQFENKLRLRDRVFGDGLGYVILRKSESILPQMQQDNTIYEIRYEFTLPDEPLHLPQNSILFFNGGMMKNGRIVGNNTSIIAPQKRLFQSVEIDGDWSNTTVYSDWIDFSKAIGVNDRNKFKSLMMLCNGNQHKTCYVSSGDYYVGLSNEDECVIDIPSNTHLIMDSTLHLMPNSFERYSIIRMLNTKNVKLEGGTIIGDVDTHLGTKGEFGHGIKISGSQNVGVCGIDIRNCWGDGIDLIEYKVNDSEYVDNENIYINKVKSCYNRRQGLSVESARNLFVESCEFSHTGQIRGTNPQAGVDIEPWRSGTDKIKDVCFFNCLLFDNKGHNENGTDFDIQANTNQDSPSYNNIKVVGCNIGKVSIKSTNGIQILSSLIENFNFGADVLEYYTDGYSLTKKGSTSDRPVFAPKAFVYLDEDLGKPIYWTGSKWVDATGADV